jgi:hypothetical protein
LGDDYRGRRRENPRTVRVIDDVRDVPIYHLEPSDGMRSPIAPVFTQRDDRQLAVHFCYCQSPRHSLPFIVSEVWRFVERSDKAIGDAESRIRADEFTESLPITLIEPVDVEMQKP